MGKKERQVEYSRRVEDLDRLFQVAAFVGIGSPLTSCGQVKQEFRSASRLSHRLLLLSSTLRHIDGRGSPGCHTTFQKTRSQWSANPGLTLRWESGPWAVPLLPGALVSSQTALP